LQPSPFNDIISVPKRERLDARDDGGTSKMENPDLCTGFVLGFLVAGVLGFVIQRIRLASIRVKQAGTKQAIVGQTLLTPTEAFLRAVAANFEIFFWILLLVAAIVVLAWILLR
jgi:hypothetical protein